MTRACVYALTLFLYRACAADMARKFGLEAEKLAENLRDNYARHDIEQDPAEPHDLALEYVNKSVHSLPTTC